MLIGITGYAQYGKDSSGQVLVEEYGFTRYAFADQMKEFALALNPFVDSKYTLRLWQLVQDQGWEGAKKNPEVRRFLQVLGTEGGRDLLGEDVWINALRMRAEQDGNMDLQGVAYGAEIVVTDVRFLNEGDWIHRLGGQVWRIERKIMVNKGTRLELEPYDNGIGLDHESERQIAQIPADKVLGAVTLDALKRQVRETIEEVTAEANAWKGEYASN